MATPPASTNATSETPKTQPARESTQPQASDELNAPADFTPPWVPTADRPVEKSPQSVSKSTSKPQQAGGPPPLPDKLPAAANASNSATNDAPIVTRRTPSVAKGSVADSARKMAVPTLPGTGEPPIVAVAATTANTVAAATPAAKVALGPTIVPELQVPELQVANVADRPTAVVEAAESVVIIVDPEEAAAAAKPAGPQPLPDEEELDEEDEELELADVIAASPPWLVSLVFHFLLILVLALLTLPQLLDSSINLDMGFSEQIGEQLDEETFSFDGLVDDTQVQSQVELDSVEDPLASPNTELLELANQPSASAPFQTPTIGLALTGREQGMKNTLLLAYGGDANTELAVYRALEWLRRNQQKDGSWRLDGPYSDGSSGDYKNRLAATSMALLAFQGAGFTHNSTRQMTDQHGKKIQADYRRVIQRAWKKMLSWQSDDGCFYRKSRVEHPHHKLYSQAQATIAICELYAMTRDPEYRRAAQRAVNFCCQIQDRDGDFPDGGWKYYEGRESDTSVTGWFVMALQSARMAGLDVPSDVFSRISEFLDSVADEGAFYSYMPGQFAKPAMTAEALLSRQYLGWAQDDERLLRGVEYLMEQPIDWSRPNTYHWYYATQVMHHMEGDTWFDWNEVMKREIPGKQVTKGPEAGSWSPAGDTWGRAGGRLYMTCLCTYMLEVYYRHLPIYASLY